MGRQGEQAAFSEALQQSPEDATQFLFHIRGPAGVGKSTLMRQLESVAREAQALTAYVDESAADVVETMEAVSAQFAQQGVDLKGFGRLLTTYRQRRHEAAAGGAAAEGAGEAAGAGRGVEPQGPSPLSVIVSQLGLAGLGMVPGAGVFTGAVDPNQLAAGADRVKALLSARLRSHEDVQLVMSPLQALVPAFLQGLGEAAAGRPWVVLFFDTYERTGPLLDGWLRDILVTERYGQLPANVLVVLAGQPRLDARCWGDWLDLVTDLPLDVFTDAEARQLLAAKGIIDEKVTEVVIELSGRLPVLVSTLAEARPASVAEVGDPSGTAVERFLKWEANPARRAAALACALPLELDEDVYRTVVDDEEAGEQFSWLRSMPFVIDRAGRTRYHDVVRSAMLRLQRQQSPLRWQEQHTRLADAFRQRLDRLEEGTAPDDGWWADDRWRTYQLQETYHRLCADHRAALPSALRDLLDAHDHDITTLRRWVRTLIQAGHDIDAGAVRKWGQELLTALDGPRPGISALTLLLSRGGLDSSGQCLGHLLRGWEHRRLDEHEQALADCTTALGLDRTGRALRGRGESYRRLGRHAEALADFDQAIEREPGIVWAFESRGVTYHSMGRYEEALADYTRAVDLDPGSVWVLGSRGLTYHSMGRYEEALADYTRAVDLDPGSVWVLGSRGLTYHSMGRYEEALADYTRAVDLDPGSAWTLGSRGASYHSMGRYDEALADFDRALALDPDSAWILANRGAAHRRSGRYADALADLTRAVDLDPDSAWPLANRGETHRLTGRYEEALVDFTRAVDLDPGSAWVLGSRGQTYRATGRYEEALADFDRALALNPEAAWIIADRGVTRRLAGRYDDALADFDRAVELTPDSLGPLVNRGVTHRVAGRYEEARADLDRALAIDGGSGWAHYEKAVVLYAVDDPEYEAYCARAIERCTPAPGHSTADTASDVGNLVLVHCLMSDWATAEGHLAAFVGCGPERGQLRELLVVLETLRSVVPSAEGHLPSFRRRLQTALDASR
ncbi:tetratricopeptide repeat protein [Streptomyces sp. NPDC059152]|uniref:tetratricopeptide repeat protein n=1 Tax=Streptomyces sp. NPDC059152 TaxID=3346742 RepID=UPI0036CA2DF9